MNVDEVIEKVTNVIEENANVKVVFGEPVEEKGVTVIPVAKTSVKGGGGVGTSSDEDGPEEGKGMGMGLMVDTTPVGYIKVKDGDAEFVEILDKSKLMLAGTIVGGIVLMLLGRGLRRR